MGFSNFCHWCKALSLHWTAPTQVTLDITGAGYEYDFTRLHSLDTGYSILVQWKDTTQRMSSP